ncbi:peptidase U32 family protein [Pseudodesulfovibrio piezophilus]|uniref:Peptidase U32 n=1 Tax=Pseudodesulfovibrio piezophilus (strain DSM 21447 / JCM 15486 / C1TLV30) TaxID=1322246 RepID=M1WJM0_PSEP2|nr:peptidase U32 family protein [Pseudodesulfovibrio piezophilus]CCH48131.1 Peptidase U32 [Pseudodesulfovibrio piezophilus C1TLV30]
MSKIHIPEIMAPAGDSASYLAAVAAGADAIYVGLKHFSARMQATNFSISELAQLASLGRDRGTKTYVAMNTMVKPNDVESAGRLIDRLQKTVKPFALIVQDLAMLELAKQVGYSGELHLSTLANLSHPSGFDVAKKLGVKRIVIPRELNLDEVKMMADACPKDLDLEIFVHGALCHCVSGRCYWSSYLGGKSGLRGRCVQPCRRLYTQQKQDAQRLFSCTDLSLDVLTKPLLSMPKVTAWKIEGRKKGPHYVYYTVRAYQMLRDNPQDAQAKKAAQELLEQALGRPSSHSLFLPQRPFQPIRPGEETGSGRLVGEIKRDQKKLFFQPREPLNPGDVIRVGYEDLPGHRTLYIRRRVPKRGRMDIPFSKKPENNRIPVGTKIFLVDRREPELTKQIKELEGELALFPAPTSKESTFTPTWPKTASRAKVRPENIIVSHTLPKGRVHGKSAFWLERSTLSKLARALVNRSQWWLPPVIWPDEDKKIRSLIKEAVKKGAREFVLNAPWQAGFFEDRKNVTLVAGPFCNASNRLTLKIMKDLGCSSAIISPELPAEDIFDLAKNPPIPLGFVVKGLWPFGIARFLAESVRYEEPIKSPMHEVMFVRKHGQNNWLYPGWELDLTEEYKNLDRAGFKSFITMKEEWPRDVPRPKRTSTFNWKLKLL